MSKPSKVFRYTDQAEEDIEDSEALQEALPDHSELDKGDEWTGTSDSSFASAPNVTRGSASNRNANIRGGE